MWNPAPGSGAKYTCHDKQKAAHGGQEKYQEGGAGRKASKDYCAPAKKDAHRAWERGRESCPASEVSLCLASLQLNQFI